MITFTHEGKEYNFRNDESEITLLELAKVSDIMNTIDAYLERWILVIDLLGDKGLSDVIDEDGLISIVENSNFTNVKNEVPEVVNVNGREYTTNVVNGTLKLSGKDLSMIERAAKKGGAWAVHAFAICYKDADLTATEHYTTAHIEHKANLFGKHLTAKEGAPVFFQLQTKLAEHIQRIANAHAKPV